MATAASATRIGAFVLGGVALVVAGVLAFGSGALFRASVERSAVFGESLQGLQVGAPVTYNGVPVGEVVRVGAVMGRDRASISNGVLFRLHAASVAIEGEAPARAGEIVDRLEAEGLRVQLGIQSFVTGALYLRLMFDDGMTPYPAPATFFDRPTIPAVPSDMARFGQVASTLGADLPALVTRLGALTEAVEGLVDGDNRARISDTLDNVASLSRELEAAAPTIGRTLDSVAEAADGFAAVAGRVDALTADLGPRLATTLDGATRAMAAVGAAAARFETLADENRRGLRDFTGQGLAEIRALAVQAQAMTRSIDRLARRIDNEGAGFLLRRESLQEYEPRAARPR
jgi:paraquat-inducible protein B